MASWTVGWAAKAVGEQLDSVESGKLLAGDGTAQRKVSQVDMHVEEQSIVMLCRLWLPSFLLEKSHRSSSWCNGNGKKTLIELIEKERLKIKIKVVVNYCRSRSGGRIWGRSKRL